MRAPSHLVLVLAIGCGGPDKTTIENGTTPPTHTGTPTGTGTGAPTGPSTTDCAELGGAVLVDDTPWPTVQGGVDAAGSSGSVVWVCPGDWTGAVVVPGSAEIRGVGGAGLVTLRGDGTGPVVKLEAGAVTLAGLTLTGGTGSTGGGLDALGAADLLVTDCTITMNDAEYGGGALIGAVARFVRTEISHNDASQYGGGLAVDEDGWVELEEVTIEGNEAVLGGGAYLWPSALVTGDPSTVVFTTNTAGSGGGAFLWSASLVGADVRDNSATSAGGGVHVLEGGTVATLAVTNNDAPLGGGISMADGAVELVDVYVGFNTASDQGGGVYADDAVLTGANFNVELNTCDGLGGGAFLRDTTWTGGALRVNEGGSGGGVYTSSSGAYVTLANLEIADNHALESGGGIDALSATVTLDALTVTGNSADIRGGGVYVSNGAIATVDDSEIASNSAVSYGGGLYANSGATVTVSATEITANLCERGGGIYVNGASSIALSGGSVTANGDGATISGGGARVESGTLDAAGTDFATGVDDNQPDDVYTVGSFGSYSAYGAGATFTCDENGCAP